MAVLKDTLIQGSARVTDTLYTNLLSSNNLNTKLLQITSDTANSINEGINFINSSSTITAHIGTSTNFGIYSAGTIILRPGAAQNNSTKGMVLSTTSLLPENAAITLGGTSNRWNGVYSSTGNFSDAVTFANNKWNIMGDDAKIGDINKGGHIGIISNNSSYDTGLFFVTGAQTDTTVGTSITWDGKKFYSAGKTNSSTNVVTYAKSTWSHGKTGAGASATTDGQIFAQKFTQAGLTYTPSGGSATTLNDSGDLIMWLSQSSTANQLYLNMIIDGNIYAGQNMYANTFNGTVTYASTTADTTNALYPVGVTSGATTTLKRDTSITFTGANIKTAGTLEFNNTSAVTSIQFDRANNPSYISIPDAQTLVIANGTTVGTSYAALGISKTSIYNAYGASIGTTSYYWGNIYAKGYIYMKGTNQYPLDFFIYNKHGNQVAEMWYDCGATETVTGGAWRFRQFSPAATPAATTSGFKETYRLPTVDNGLTEDKNYNILTTKNAITVAQGGTGATTFTSDCVIVGNGTNAMTSRGLKVTGATTDNVILTCASADKTLKLSSTSTLYLNSKTSTSIIFQQNDSEIARFNVNGNLALGVKTDSAAIGTQNTHKLYVSGNSCFNGKIAFGAQASNAITEKASYQYINSGVFQRGSIFTATSSAAAGGNATDGYTGARWVFNLGIATPADGDIITIKVPVASHDYGTYISTDNGTTYKPIGILGGTTRLTGQYGANTILTLAYDADGTINSMFPATGGSTARSNISGGCWRVVNYYDSGFNEWNLRQYTIKAVNAITSEHIIGGTDSGYSNIDSGTAFDIRYAVLYAGSNISAGSTGTNNFIHHYAINIKNSSNANITLTTYKNVYIKGTISGHLFTPITGGSPYVSDITAADDGYAYYYIGRCYSSNNAFTFDATGKSIFWYKNGAIRQYGDYGISFVAYGGTLATNGWKTLHGKTNGPHISVAYNNASRDWNTSTYSASLTWGGIGDTHGLIECCYNSPIVSFGGSSTSNGTDNDPKWYFKLIGTSAQSYTFPTTSKTLAATDGSNASGTWGISVSGNAANVTGTVTYQHGGTGLTTLGSAGQVLKVNSSANGIEWGTVSTADEKVKVAANITTAADYPVVFANSNKSTTAAETAGLNKSGTKFYFNPSTGLLTATQVANAIWNDYAEYRKQLYTIQPGYVIKDTDSGYVVKANERLIPGAQIVSDTWGHSMGKTDECQTPVAVAGRVLAYTYRPREQYHAGMAVCSAPDGTIDIMTREEIRDYPDAIIGIVSEIPDYEEWGSGKVKVDGRIWIKVR